MAVHALVVRYESFVDVDSEILKKNYLYVLMFIKILFLTQCQQYSNH